MGAKKNDEKGAKKNDEKGLAQAAATPSGLARVEIPEEFLVVSAPTGLQRITLAQGQMQLILEGKCSPGEFLLGQDNVRLGRAFPAYVAAWRSKALHVVNDEVVTESYDARSPEFARIVRDGDRAEKVEGVKYYHGPEFLLWTKDGWGTLMFSGTARTRGRTVYEIGRRSMPADAPVNHLGGGVFIGSETKKTSKYTWLVPTVAEADVAAPHAYELAAARAAFLAVTPAATAPQEEQI